ncbi:hypothetical protein [Agromyces sp. SYSU T00194]|uniref:hypothetical protein n=1 Tax=Agromyces chitinivorans TaxID=3158560 RepID=UPI0033934F93
MALITLADAKKSIYNGYAGSSTADDTDIQEYIDAATPVIEDIVGPLEADTIVYERDGGKTGIQLPTAIASVDEVLEDDVEIADYFASKSAGIIYAGTRTNRRQFSPGTRNIQATVTVGRTVPPNVKLATRELVRFWWQQGRQGNNRPSLGVESPGEPMVNTPSGFAVPRRVWELCRPDRVIGQFG